MSCSWSKGGGVVRILVACDLVGCGEVGVPVSRSLSLEGGRFGAPEGWVCVSGGGAPSGGWSFCSAFHAATFLTQEREVEGSRAAA